MASHSSDRCLSLLAAGYSTAEAKMIASWQVELPQLSELKQLVLQMVEMSNSYCKAGDDASAQAIQSQKTAGQAHSKPASDR
jgi:hypothetical protein